MSYPLPAFLAQHVLAGILLPDEPLAAAAQNHHGLVRERCETTGSPAIQNTDEEEHTINGRQLLMALACMP